MVGLITGEAAFITAPMGWPRPVERVSIGRRMVEPATGTMVRVRRMGRGVGLQAGAMVPEALPVGGAAPPPGAVAAAAWTAIAVVLPRGAVDRDRLPVGVAILPPGADANPLSSGTV